MAFVLIEDIYLNSTTTKTTTTTTKNGEDRRRRRRRRNLLQQGKHRKIYKPEPKKQPEGSVNNM